MYKSDDQSLEYMNIYISVTGMEKGLKRDDQVWSLHNIWGFQCGCWGICRRTMVVPIHMCSGFPTGRLEQMIMTS